MLKFFENDWIKEIKDFVVSAFIALLIVVPFRYFLVEPYIVSGASMSPNYATGDYIVVNKLVGEITKPKRGDVLVFVPPHERKDSWKNNIMVIDERVKYIKRVIGLPGETVKIKDKKVYIKKPDWTEFKVLEEPYLKNHNLTHENTITLAGDEYFMLGDNRGNSYDSEEWGPIRYDDIIGEPILRIFPFDNFGTKPAFYKFDF